MGGEILSKKFLRLSIPGFAVRLPNEERAIVHPQMGGRMKIKLISIIVLSVFSTVAFADESAPEFNCKKKVILEYIPGDRWSDLESALPRHLEYLAEQLKNGNLEFAGPLVVDSSDPIGGLAIFNLSDIKAVMNLSQNDPLITEGIATFSVRNWVQCVLK